MTLVGTEELDAAGVTYDSAAQADHLIAHIEGLITINHPRLSLAASTESTVTVHGTWGQELALPARPVLSVASVTIDGAEVPADSYTHTRRALLLRQPGSAPKWPSAMAENGPANWGGLNANVTVTYSHGLTDEAKAAVVGIITQAIGRHLAAPAGVRQESFGASSISYSGGPDGLGGLGLSKSDQKTLRRLAR